MVAHEAHQLRIRREGRPSVRVGELSREGDQDLPLGGTGALRGLSDQRGAHAQLRGEVLAGSGAPGEAI